MGPPAGGTNGAPPISNGPAVRPLVNGGPVINGPGPSLAPPTAPPTFTSSNGAAAAHQPSRPGGPPPAQPPLVNGFSSQPAAGAPPPGPLGPPGPGAAPPVPGPALAPNTSTFSRRYPTTVQPGTQPPAMQSNMPPPASSSYQPPAGNMPPMPPTSSYPPGPQPPLATSGYGMPPMNGQPTTSSMGQGQPPAPNRFGQADVSNLSGRLGGLSVTQTGFQKMWGQESIDLLQNRHILPPEPLKPPMARLQAEQWSNINCSPDIFRATLTKIPETDALLKKARLPLGVLIHPFKDLSHLPVIQCTTIVRCRSCRTYINPFVHFVDQRRWRCNLCYRVNELPEEFLYDPVSKSYGDPSRRPECKSSTIEFIAPQVGWC